MSIPYVTVGVKDPVSIPLIFTYLSVLIFFAFYYFFPLCSFHLMSLSILYIAILALNLFLSTHTFPTLPLLHRVPFPYLSSLIFQYLSRCLSWLSVLLLRLSWLFPSHSGSDQSRTQMRVLGHSLVCSLVCSHRSLVELALPSPALSRLLACSLYSPPCSWESE